MRKFLITSLVAYASIVANSKAFGYSHLRYMGVDVGQTFSKSTVFEYVHTDKKHYYSPNFISGYSGYRIGQYAAFEFGGFVSVSVNSSKTHREGDAKHSGMFMGFAFFLPVNDKIEFCPSVGVAQVFAHVNKPNVFNAKDDGVVPRLTFGMQYAITDNVKIRSSVAWHKMNGIYSNVIASNNTLHVGLGLSYSFDPF